MSSTDVYGNSEQGATPGRVCTVEIGGDEFSNRKAMFESSPHSPAIQLFLPDEGWVSGMRLLANYHATACQVSQISRRS